MGLSPEQATEIIERCFAAIADLDAERLLSHYTEDYVLELPYYLPDEPFVAEGREAVRPFLVSLLGIQRMFITLHGTHWIESEQLMIAEYTSTGEFLDNGEPYQNRYVGYWYFEGERVRRLREYYNPQAPRASAID